MSRGEKKEQRDRGRERPRKEGGKHQREQVRHSQINATFVDKRKAAKGNERK